MNTKATFKLIAIFAFFTILTSEETIKYANFRTENYNAFFPFGSTVGIYCEQETNILQVEALSNMKEVNNIVVKSQLQDTFYTTYQLEVINSTTILLTINKLTSQINGTLFRCKHRKELSVTIVGFKPIDVKANPMCTSTYQSRFIFEDLVQSDIEMNCTSEEGDPPVMMSTYIRDGDKINDVTNNSTITVSSHPSKTLSFASYFNSSFNNSVFACNVSQQLPAPYQRFQGSCSFGPILFLPLFSVTATPSNVNFSDVRNAVLRCTSNVSEVRLSWTEIPTHWKYNTRESYAAIELTVSDTGRGVYSGDIQCIGYYGDRNITSMIEISATNNPGRVIAVLLVVIFICSFICVIIIAVRKYNLNVPNCSRKSRSTRNVQAGENSSTNNANDGNITINDDLVSPIASQTDNDNVLNVPGMTDNILYERYTERENQHKKSSKTIKQVKGEVIEMVENEIYETTSTSRPDNVNPLYDSISPQHKQGNCN